MTNQPELVACPFCGAENTDVGFIGHTDNCYLMLKYMGVAKKAQLIKAWNTRPVEDALRAVVDCVKRRHEYQTPALYGADLDFYLRQLGDK